MALKLPALKYADKIKQNVQMEFKGYNHNLFAGNGEIYDMKNLTSDYYPLLSPRPLRYKVRTLTDPNGLFAHDNLVWADGTTLYVDGEEEGSVTDDAKTFAALGSYIIVLPDKKYYNTATETFGDLAETYTATAGQISFTDGTLYGESAEACALVTSGSAFAFKEGDGVIISGCTSLEKNNKTAVIREISSDKKTLTFDENIFDIGTESAAVTIARSVPDIDYICENENRLWGCKGDTIYASKLGDPFNWNVFDLLSSDSYAASVGSAGDFTGCVSYLGYPCFFKAEHVYKVYGSKPSNYQVMGSASAGVESGSGKSLAIAGEVLFYKSRIGIMAYTGGTPKCVSEALGPDRYTDAVGGSDGKKYYVSMKNSESKYTLFVYDTEKGLWHKEDESQVTAWAWKSNLYMLKANGEMWTAGAVTSTPSGSTAETALSSIAEFGDFTEANPNKKQTAKILLRISLNSGASVSVYVKYDGEDTWTLVRTLSAAVKKSYYIALPPRRCDYYRIKLTGTGAYKLHSLTRETSRGSSN